MQGHFGQKKLHKHTSTNALGKTGPDLDSGFGSGKWFRDSFASVFEHFHCSKECALQHQYANRNNLISLFIQPQDNTDAEVIQHVLFRQSSAA